MSNRSGASSPATPATITGGIASSTLLDPSFEDELKRLSTYANTKLETVFRDLLTELFKQTPDDPIQFMIQFLTELQEESKGATPIPKATKQARNDDNDDLDEEERGDIPHELPKMAVSGSGAPKKAVRRRTGVSAEPMSMSTVSSTPSRVIPKTEADRANIVASVKNNFLFNSLDKEQMRIVVDAMEHKKFNKGDVVIKQGEDGEDFYVLESGECHCFLNQPGDAPPKKVKEYIYGESFGELALMYNCPRAATIRAVTAVSVWAMDRHTFRKVLMNTTSQKRTRYEAFLKDVGLLSSLDRYERAKIADALIDRTYSAGEYIITAGDEKDRNFYFLEEGVAIATKVLEEDKENKSGPTEVMRYKPGGFFGELALITDQPRAANVVALEDCKCVTLDRDSFTRLLGPCEDILKRNKGNYAKIEEQIRGGKKSGATTVNTAQPTVS